MDSIWSLMYGLVFNNYDTADKVGREKTNGYTVDTCDTCDCGYETAIWYQDNDMVIVERYANKEAAIAGHAKWIEFVKTNPLTVYSVQFYRECDLR